MHPKKRLFRPAHYIVLGFITSIIIGSLLLKLPIASSSGESMPYSDALFTAASSVCVTGLTTVDIGSAFSTFGHVVILLLIQLGGLGFMTFATIIFAALRVRVGLRERILLRESLNEDSLHGLTGLVYKILLLSFGIECVGALIFMTQFIPMYGSYGIFISIFHSVSSFCNAGIDIFGGQQSMMVFSGNSTVLITTMLLFILGGLGFTVLLDIIKRNRKPMLHTRIVLAGTSVLLVGGALFFIFAEWGNAFAGMTIGEKALAGTFQSATMRTAGYITFDQNALYPHSRIFSMLLMFIGGAPASTAGGIKITTLAVILASVRSTIHNREDVEIGKRRIGKGLIRRAAAIAVIAATCMIAVSIMLCISESSSGLSIEHALYLVFSSFSTTGISLGTVSGLNGFSRLLLMAAMFLGRVGPFTLALAIGGRSKPGSIRYPEDKLIIG